MRQCQQTGMILSGTTIGFKCKFEMKIYYSSLTNQGEAEAILSRMRQQLRERIPRKEQLFLNNFKMIENVDKKIAAATAQHGLLKR